MSATTAVETPLCHYFDPPSAPSSFSLTSFPFTLSFSPSDLYRVQLNSVFRLGPNLSIFYASLIINVLILFSIYQIVAVKIKNLVISMFNTAAKKREFHRPSSLPSILLSILNCTPSFTTRLLLFPLCYILFGILLVLPTNICFLGYCGEWNIGNGFSHVFYFFAGALAAFIFECIFKTSFFPSLHQPLSPGRPFLYRMRAPVRRVARLLLTPLVDFDDTGLDVASARGSLCETSLLWRFAPDLLLFLLIYLFVKGIVRNPSLFWSCK